MEPIDSNKIVQNTFTESYKKNVDFCMWRVCAVQCSVGKVIFQLGYLVLIGASCAAARV